MEDDRRAAYQQLLAADLNKRVLVVMFAIAMAFYVFALVNLLANNLTMFVADVYLATFLLLLAYVMKKSWFSAIAASQLLLLLFVFSLLGVYMLPYSYHGAFYNYTVIPFFALYVLGSRMGLMYCVAVLMLLWLACLGAYRQWFEVCYSMDQTLMFTPLFIFNLICAWLFERMREQKSITSYEQGLHREGLLNAVGAVYYRADMDGVLQEISPAICQISGYDVAELLGTSILDHYAYPDERRLFTNKLQAEGCVKNYCVRLVKKSGQHCVISVSSYIVLAKDGTAQYIEGVFLDVSEEQRLDKERQESLAHLRDLSLVEAALSGLEMIPSLRKSMQQVLQIYGANRAFLLPVKAANQAAGSAAIVDGFVEQQGGYTLMGGDFVREDGFVAMLRETETETEIFPLETAKSSGFSPELLEKYHIKSQLIVLVQVRKGDLWLMGLHHCAAEVVWTTQQKRLFIGISHRIRGTLGQLLLQHDLKETVAQVQAASQAKGAFLATMSHELRTPLHGVVGLLDLLSIDADNLSQTQHKNLALAQNSAHVLTSLIDDVLDLSKIESGKIDIQQQAFNLEDALRQALVPFVVKAREKGLLLSLELRNIPCWIKGDVLRFRQVLLNLVGNAVKFTHQGFVRVVVSQADAMLRVDIQDSGIGIDEAKQKHVFEPFMQVHDVHILGDNLQQKGTGLGTTISRSFVEMMGGELDFTSRLNKGTTFTIKLPLHVEGDAYTSLCLQAEQLADVTSDDEKKRDKVATRQWRVLLAEDDPIGRRIAEKRLQREGFSVFLAADGQEAWQMMQQARFDLLLTDVRMPKMDGLALVEKVRAWEAAQGQAAMLIIGLSAHALEAVKHKALALGMNDFISKPVDMKILMQKLEQHCVRQGVERC